MFTAWKVSKYGAFSGTYFPVFSPNTGKYGPEKTPYLDTFHGVASHAFITDPLFSFTVYIVVSFA